MKHGSYRTKGPRRLAKNRRFWMGYHQQLKALLVDHELADWQASHMAEIREELLSARVSEECAEPCGCL